MGIRFFALELDVTVTKFINLNQHFVLGTWCALGKIVLLRIC